MTDLWGMEHLLAPSILAADFANLERDIKLVNASEADAEPANEDDATTAHDNDPPGTLVCDLAHPRAIAREEPCSY